MIEALFTSAGITLGWLLNEFSFFLRSRKDHVKVRKQVLFNLLEIRHHLKQLDLKDDIVRMRSKLMLLIPEQERSKQAMDSLDDLLYQVLPELVEPMISKNIKNINTKYPMIIDSLSATDPITAYRLSGKSNIVDAFDELKNFYGSMSKRHPEDKDAIMKISSGMTQRMKPDMIKNGVESLEEEIIEIAASIGFMTNRSVKRLFKYEKEPVDTSEDEKSFQAIKEILENLGVFK